MPTIYWRGPERTDSPHQVRSLRQARRHRRSPKHGWMSDDGAFEGDTLADNLEDYPGVPFTQDDGDGLPDENWLKADIQTWLADHGVQMSGVRATKAKMLERVDEVLAAEVATEEE